MLPRARPQLLLTSSQTKWATDWKLNLKEKPWFRVTGELVPHEDPGVLALGGESREEVLGQKGVVGTEAFHTCLPHSPRETHPSKILEPSNLHLSISGGHFP